MRCGQPGSPVGLLWSEAADFDSTPEFTITSAGGDSLPVPPLNELGSGLYTATWVVPDGAEGVYTAALAGEVDFVETVSVETVFVPAANTYLSLEDFKGELHIDDAAEDTRLASLLVAASGAIDAEVGRTFQVPSSTSEVDYFLPRMEYSYEANTTVIYVNDFATMEGLVVEYGMPFGGRRLVPAERVLPMRVQPSRDWPYERLAVNADLRGYPLLWVTAQHGWPAVPAQVVEATLLQAKRTYSRKGAPEGYNGPAEWGIIRVPRLDVDVRNLLSGFRKPVAA